MNIFNHTESDFSIDVSKIVAMEKRMVSLSKGAGFTSELGYRIWTTGGTIDVTEKLGKSIKAKWNQT